MRERPAEGRAEFYLENDRVVFAASYHVKRGNCCESGCRHCPYGFNKNKARPKVTLSWSGGKDSAFALHKIISEQKLEVVGLHTVIDEDSKRVGLHEVPEVLIEKQARSLRIPLEKIYVPSKDASSYASLMHQFYGRCVNVGISGVVFGDIFLEDLRDYKEHLLEPFKLVGYFPLWQLDTTAILKDLLDVGYKTKICAARADLFSKNQLGQVLDAQVFGSIPAYVDPCGENGEFHTFVYDGPTFTEQIPVVEGAIMKKSYSYTKTSPDGTLEEMKSSYWVQDLHL